MRVILSITISLMNSQYSSLYSTSLMTYLIVLLMISSIVVHSLKKSCCIRSHSYVKHSYLNLAIDTNIMTQIQQKPKIIFVLGGPGAGKGTQCLRLSTEYGMKHLSAGELLREEMSTQGSEHGSLINSYLKEGKIVPVKITLDLLKRKILSIDNPCNRFLIDGFPRNWDNVQGWEEYMSTVCDMERVIFIECDQDELEKRLLDRGKTSGRSDDNIESARKRFVTFKESTLPVVEYYEKMNQVTRVDGNQGLDEVFNTIKSAIVPSIQSEIVLLTQQLLNYISSNDYDNYVQLVHPSLIAIEPEGNGVIIEGLDFHKKMFEVTANKSSIVSTVLDPRVQVFGKVAVISYKREVKTELSTSYYLESRVWQLDNGKWKLFQFHRSLNSA